MTLTDFIKQSSRTMAPVHHPDNIKIETFHGMIGIATEAGEILDAAKKSYFYGRPLNRENLREELGDLMWYVAAIIRSEDWDLEEIMAENIQKLMVRYPEKFTQEDAYVRRDKQ